METVQTTAQGGIPRTKNGKPLYTVYKNKDGVEFKVINFDNEDIVPNYGIVEFEAFKKKDYERIRDTKFACPVVKDAKTGIFYGMFNGFHPSGDPKWLDFPLGMINIYDRSNPFDAKKSFILANSPLTEGSPTALFGRLIKFRLVDKEKAAFEKIKKINDGERALTLAKGLYGEKLTNIARDLGINTNVSVNMLTAEVLERAQDSPVEFLRIYEHPHREAITILNKAISTKVVENDLMTGDFSYSGLPLGHNFDWAVKYLLENPTVMVSINMKATEREASSIKAMQINNAEVKDSSSPDNAELIALRKQLADMQAEKEALSKDKPEPSLNPLEKELDELKKEAALIGGNLVKGLHTFKPTAESIAKLRAKIEATKK